MILKTLYLKVGDLSLPTEFTYGFLKRSRFICNYLEREVLGKIRFRTEGFDRISIAVSSKPKDGVFVNTSNVACVDIPFDRRKYEGKSGASLSTYYFERLKEGLEKCAQFKEIPKDAMLEGLETFRSGGMKNEWIHADRSFKKLSLRACLKCQLTQESFQLRLEVFHADKRVLDAEVLQTDPDENAFAYRFKDVKVDGDYLVVTSKTSEPLWRERISKLIK